MQWLSHSMYQIDLEHCCIICLYLNDECLCLIEVQKIMFIMFYTLLLIVFKIVFVSRWIVGYLYFTLPENVRIEVVDDKSITNEHPFFSKFFRYYSFTGK